MDQLRRRLGHYNVSNADLEDELEYNFGRKEELKEKVKDLEAEVKETNALNLSNAKVCVDKEYENAQLKKKIIILEKENSELHKAETHTKKGNGKEKGELVTKLEEKVRELGDQIKEMYNTNRVVGQNLEDLNKKYIVLTEENTKLVNVGQENENLQMENKMLATKINELELENNRIKEYQSTETENSKQSTKTKCEELRDLLKCDDCDQTFKTKEGFIQHVKAIHVQKVECSQCDRRVKNITEMKDHKKKEHDKKNLKESLIQRQISLSHEIKNQRETLYKKIYNLKQRETKKIGHCKCQGNTCKINHHKFKWMASKADILFEELLHFCYHESRGLNSIIYICPYCNDGFFDKTDLECREDIVHLSCFENQTKPCQCEICGNLFQTMESLKSHMGMHQDLTMYICNHCECVFKMETELTHHVQSVHTPHYTCEVYSETLRRTANFENHMTLQPANCNDSGRKF